MESARERERERERARETWRERGGERERVSVRERERERARDREVERERDRARGRERKGEREREPLLHRAQVSCSIRYVSGSASRCRRTAGWREDGGVSWPLRTRSWRTSCAGPTVGSGPVPLGLSA